MADIIHDVIVIGAGVSGLSAAKLLRDSGVENVLVLEARNRVGGRTWTVKNDAVGWLDVGGAYIGRTQNHLLRMIKELGLKMYPVNEVEKIVLYNGYTGKRYLFASDEMPNVGLFANLDFNNILRLMDKMGEEIPAEAPWAAPNALKWDRMSFAQFIDENMSTKSGKSFMRTFISTCVTSEMHESSLLWFLWYVKQCGGSMPIFSTTGGGQEFKMHGGTNQITEKLAEIVGSDRVKLENAVYSLEQVNDELCIVKTLNGGEYRARHVIMATPPAVQQKIHYNPPLPPMRNQLIQRAPQGTTYKCTLYYERNFWRSKDMCGSMIFYGPDEEFPMTYSLDDSKPDGSHPAIVGFVPADKARLVVKLSREERCHLIAKSFAKAFGIEEAAHPIHYEEQNWSGEQYSGGCYTMTCPPGFLTQYGPYLREPVGRMHFAGTETATEWSGYINGAIQAGERAAREILATMKLITETEIWQEEPVSKEYPPMPFKRTFYERIAPSPRCLRNTILLTNLGLLVGFCLFKRPETIVGAISKLKLKLF